jgi:myosin-5
MSTAELYCKGARVWLRDEQRVWKSGVLTTNWKGSQLSVEDETGKVIGITIAKDGDLPPLRNPDILVGENDLTTLSYLHEPAGTVWVVVKSITYVY